MKAAGWVVAAGLGLFGIATLVTDPEFRDKWSEHPTKAWKDRLTDIAIDKIVRKYPDRGMPNTAATKPIEPIGWPHVPHAPSPKTGAAPDEHDGAPSSPAAAKARPAHSEPARERGIKRSRNGAYRRLNEAKFLKRHPEVHFHAAASDRREALSDEQAFRLLEKLEAIAKGAPSRCSVSGTFGVQEYGFGDSGRVYVRRDAARARLDIVLLGNKQTQQDDCERLRFEFGR